MVLNYPETGGTDWGSKFKHPHARWKTQKDPSHNELPYKGHNQGSIWDFGCWETWRISHKLARFDMTPPPPSKRTLLYTIHIFVIGKNKMNDQSEMKYTHGSCF